MLAIATALGLQLQGERTPEQQVGDFLRTRHLLLVLDNFEHLLEGAPLVGELLARAPQLWILVTSRQRLKLSSETVIFLDGLRLPAEPSDDPLTIRPCRCSCCTPAACVLTMSRMNKTWQGSWRSAAWCTECRSAFCSPRPGHACISPAEIAAEIGSDLGFLQTDMPDVPARQRNLRQLFLHTWSRLSAAERDAFMRLSVFRGGAT